MALQGFVLVVCLLQLTTVNICSGANLKPWKEQVEQNSNVLKIDFGLNVDLDAVTEKTVKTVVVEPLSEEVYAGRSVEAASTSCTGLSGFHCLDCSTFKVCDGQETPLYTSSCSADLPYCEAGACVAQSSSNKCAAPQSTFKCSGDGFYPDPVNCQKYYHCSKESTTSTWSVAAYNCPSGFAYNSATNNCRRSLRACRTFTCTANKMATYRQNAAYYGFCTSSTPTVGMTVFKCPDTKNMVYNLNTFACEYQCKREGYFADASDESKYFFCYRDRLVFKVTAGKCPNGLLFQNGQCQEKSNIAKQLEELLKLVETLKAGVTDPTDPNEQPTGAVDSEKLLDLLTGTADPELLASIVEGKVTVDPKVLVQLLADPTATIDNNVLTDILKGNPSLGPQVLAEIQAGKTIPSGTLDIIRAAIPNLIDPVTTLGFLNGDSVLTQDLMEDIISGKLLIDPTALTESLAAVNPVVLATTLNSNPDLATLLLSEIEAGRISVTNDILAIIKQKPTIDPLELEAVLVDAVANRPLYDDLVAGKYKINPTDLTAILVNPNVNVNVNAQTLKEILSGDSTLAQAVHDEINGSVIPADIQAVIDAAIVRRTSLRPAANRRRVPTVTAHESPAFAFKYAISAPAGKTKGSYNVKANQNA